jgi:hypothetical protein
MFLQFTQAGRTANAKEKEEREGEKRDIGTH